MAGQSAARARVLHRLWTENHRLRERLMADVLAARKRLRRNKRRAARAQEGLRGKNARMEAAIARIKDTLRAMTAEYESAEAKLRAAGIAGPEADPPTSEESDSGSSDGGGGRRGRRGTQLRSPSADARARAEAERAAADAEEAMFPYAPAWDEDVSLHCAVLRCARMLC